MKKIVKILQAVKDFDYKTFFKESLFLAKFFVLVIIFLFFDVLRYVYRFIMKIPIIKKISVFNVLSRAIKKVYEMLVKVFNTTDDGEIASLDLINLAIKNLKAKKHRTIITIGGMAIGFGSVIFLLSIGYGTQKLVVSRVAKLDEMKQISVTTGQASSLVINDKIIQDISDIEHVSSVLPLVSVVSKVEYNNSVSDAVAYGVSKEYLQASAIKPTKGELFEDSLDDVQESSAVEQKGEVAGVTTEKVSNAKLYKQYSQVDYAIYPLVWKKVYKEPSLDSEVVGYTQRISGLTTGYEVWGEKYDLDIEGFPEGIDYFGNEYSVWIQNSFPIWIKEVCSESNVNCVDKTYVVHTEGGIQKSLKGYITEDAVTIQRYEIAQDDLPEVKEGEKVADVQFLFKDREYHALYSEPDNQTKKLNLFTQTDTVSKLRDGELVFGTAYSDVLGWGSSALNANGKELGYWLRAKLPVWRQLDCEDCEKLFLKEVDTYGTQIEAYAFIPANEVVIDQLDLPPVFGKVLGDATESAELVSSDSAALDSGESDSEDVTLSDGTVLKSTQKEDGTTDWVTINSQDGSGSTTENTNIVSFASSAKKVTLINRAMLNILGMDENEAIDTKFSATLLLSSDFYDGDYSAQSELTEFTIIGILPEEKTPAFYIPFSDIKNLGVQNYTQLKVIVDDQKHLKDIRAKIEALGYKTTSVVDTVERINSLFATVKILLSILGFIALSVAALGMFNTLTVSLLEKTREVGLMKTIGMKSNEVKRLFLAESIIMGLSGGIFGLFIGSLAGNFISFLLSTVSVTKGSGYINLVDIPIFLMAGIITLSFFIGIATGIYPARRATKISALNALRYE